MTAKPFNFNRKKYALSGVEGLPRESSRFTGKEWDEETRLYYMSARYQNPMTSRWMSADPAGAGLVNPQNENASLISGLNWYSYCDNNPVIYDDPTGHAPRNLTDAQRKKYMDFVAGFSSYDASTNSMGLPSSYDCADVGTWLYSKGLEKATGVTDSYKNLQRGDENISSISSIHSSDFFGDNENNISMYGETSFNSDSVEVGSVGVFKAPEGASWTGHVVTVTGVSRDKDGNVTSIDLIQGHTSRSADRTTLSSQSDLDSFLGTFLGWGELGKGSATINSNPEPVNRSTGSDDLTKD